MKRPLYLVVPCAVLAGLMLGGLGSRRELRGVREELRKARELMNSSGTDARTDVSRMTQLLGVRPVARPKQESIPSVPSAPPASAAAPETSHTNAPAEDPRPATREPTRDEKAEAREERMQRDIDQAIELWQLRSEIARSTFVANAALSGEDVSNFDVLMDAMNLRLEDLIAAWSKAATQKERLDSEDGIRLMNGVTEVLVLTYDEMDHKLSADWRETGGTGLRLMDFVDPAVARPLVDLGSKMEDMGGSFNEANDPLLNER